MKYEREDFYDDRGALKTELLFLETADSRRKLKYPPLYTLKEFEKNDLPSAYQIFMSSADEYDAAMKLVGSMRHWRRLCGLKWFMNGIPTAGFDGLAKWRKDMEMRDKSKAKKQLMEAAEAGVVSAQRAIYLADSKPTRRKTKAEQQVDRTETDRINNIKEIFGDV